jgi:hypothetical protein
VVAFTVLVEVDSIVRVEVTFKVLVEDTSTVETVRVAVTLEVVRAVLVRVVSTRIVGEYEVDVTIRVDVAFTVGE